MIKEPMPSEAPPSLWQNLVARLQFICTPRMLWKAFLAAGPVGTVLVALNQGDVWWSGHVIRGVFVKSLLTRMALPGV